MDEKINVAAILKDKPKGTKLYADAFGELSIEDIYTGDKEDKDELGITLLSSVGDELIFYNDGRYTTQGESILVPSKEMRNWGKFVWKKGDVLVNSRGLKILFDRWANDNYTSFYAKTINLVEDGFLDTNLHTLASEKEAKSFIKCIEEKLGGKLNRETLKIEKAQPEFKDGDIAFADYGNRQDVFIVSDKTDLSEGYSSFIFLDLRGLTLSMGCRTCFFKKNLCELRLATEEEKKQLFSSLEKKGKRWDAENKMVVDLKPKVELKPFDKVLVRDSKSDNWRANLFGYIGKDGYYRCVYANWAYCIPYIGNESLLGTTKDVEG
jgi:hypothetical protein